MKPKKIGNFLCVSDSVKLFFLFHGTLTAWRSVRLYIISQWFNCVLTLRYQWYKSILIRPRTTEALDRIWWPICKIFTILSNHPVVIPRSYCDVHLIRSPWVVLDHLWYLVWGFFFHPAYLRNKIMRETSFLPTFYSFCFLFYWITYQTHNQTS